MPNADLAGNQAHSTSSLHHPHIQRSPTRSRFIVELLLALLLTRIPYLSVPFKWLESYFHELSHGIATLITGGLVSHIQLFPNGAGLCFSQGGWPIGIAFSGYLGAAIWGYLIFIVATWQNGIRFSFAVLGAVVGITLVLWGRDLLTIGILLVLMVLFLLPLKLSQSRVLTSGLRIMGLMVMLNALASPMVLLGLDGEGDAAHLSALTWIPAWIWVLLWLVLSGACLLMSWRRIDGLATKSAK